MLIGDIDISSLDDRKLTQLRRDRIGFIFQAFNLVPTLTAAENIALPARLAGRKPDRDWFDHVVETVGLTHRLEHRPSELSGGQQQRVAVARALAARPQIIFADEPTGNLDSRTGAEILSFMRTAVREFGQTIVMVTHDPIAASYADRAVFLADGRIVDDIDDPTADSVLDRIRTSEADRHVHAHHQGARRPQAAIPHDRRRRPPRRRLHGRHHGVHRHDRCHFDTVLADADEGVDAYVRAPSEIDLGYGEPGPRLDASLADSVASVAGVDEVALRINGYAQLVGPDGDPVGNRKKNPAFGTNWVTVDDLNPYRAVERSRSRQR